MSSNSCFFFLCPVIQVPWCPPVAAALSLYPPVAAVSVSSSGRCLCVLRWPRLCVSQCPLCLSSSVFRVPVAVTVSDRSPVCVGQGQAGGARCVQQQQRPWRRHQPTAEERRQRTTSSDSTPTLQLVERILNDVHLPPQYYTQHLPVCSDKVRRRPAPRTSGQDHSGIRSDDRRHLDQRPVSPKNNSRLQLFFDETIFFTCPSTTHPPYFLSKNNRNRLLFFGETGIRTTEGQGQMTGATAQIRTTAGQGQTTGATEQDHSGTMSDEWEHRSGPVTIEWQGQITGTYKYNIEVQTSGYICLFNTTLHTVCVLIAFRVRVIRAMRWKPMCLNRNRIHFPQLRVNCVVSKRGSGNGEAFN